MPGKKIKRIKQSAGNLILKGLYLSEEKKVRRMFEIAPKPIYHIHIRKAAGTTINFAFLSNANNTDTNALYKRLSDKPNHRVIADGKVFVGWNLALIYGGNYSYAFSHTPLHQLRFRKEMFLFTCLRDPAKRVISHYNMLKYYQKNNIRHSCMKIEGKWPGRSFDHFLDNIPKENLLNQLYMFSKEFDIDEAVDNILNLDLVMFTEELERGLQKLEMLTGWSLPTSRKKNYGHKEDITGEQISRLREMLEYEYRILSKLKSEA